MPDISPGSEHGKPTEEARVAVAVLLEESLPFTSDHNTVCKEEEDKHLKLLRVACSHLL